MNVCQECGWEHGEFVAVEGRTVMLRVERQDTGLWLCQFCAKGEWHGGKRVLLRTVGEFSIVTSKVHLPEGVVPAVFCWDDGHEVAFVPSEDHVRVFVMEEAFRARPEGRLNWRVSDVEELASRLEETLRGLDYSREA